MSFTHRSSGCDFLRLISADVTVLKWWPWHKKSDTLKSSGVMMVPVSTTTHISHIFLSLWGPVTVINASNRLTWTSKKILHCATTDFTSSKLRNPARCTDSDNESAIVSFIQFTPNERWNAAELHKPPAFLLRKTQWNFNQACRRSARLQQQRDRTKEFSVSRCRFVKHRGRYSTLRAKKKWSGTLLEVKIWDFHSKVWTEEAS